MKKDVLRKIVNIEFLELKIQNYLISEELSVQQRKLLTHLRCRMIKVRANFTKMYDSKYCQICLQIGEYFEDSQEHLIRCNSLFKDGKIDIGTQYSDIFSEKIDQQERIAILIEEKLKLR